MVQVYEKHEIEELEKIKKYIIESLPVVEECIECKEVKEEQSESRSFIKKLSKKLGNSKSNAKILENHVHIDKLKRGLPISGRFYMG
ncbi:MAG: hypothetical protein ACFE8E_13320 [Candidatus Hodarchaeota archaeon]